MAVLIRLFLALVLGNSAIFGLEFTDDSFHYSVYLDPAETYKLFWKYNENDITFKVKVETTGYVGFGLSTNEGMKGADIVIGGVQSGKTYLSDHHATGNTKAEKDPQQNWKLLFAEEDGTSTVLVFKRPLKSCDTENDLDIEEGNLCLIWAYGDDDPDPPSEIQMESNLGFKRVWLINGPSNPYVAMETTDSMIPMTTMADGTVQMEFKNPNVPITSTEPTYYEVGLKFPELTGKHHLVKMEPLIQSGNEDLMYHIVLYGCPNEVPESFHGRHFDIRDELVMEILQCTTYLASWSTGSGVFEYPPEYGFPIGGPDNPIKFVRVETMFSNPARTTGLRDSSGLRLTLVPATREHDVGFLRVGHSPIFGGSHIVPGGVTDFLVRGHCMADCLAKGLQDNPKGITITGLGFFAHKNATSIVLRHIRNGREIRPIAEEPKLDFYSQEMIVLQEPVQVQQGDSIVIDCRLNTTGAKVLTAGAEADNQPCLANLMYYPPIDLSFCESASPPTEFLKVFDNFRYSGSAWSPQIQSPAKWRGKSFHEALATMDVSSAETKRALQRQMTQGNVSSFCFRGDQPFAILPNQPITVPPSFEYRPEPISPCSGQDSPGSKPPANTSGSNVISGNSIIAYLCVMFYSLVQSQR